MYAHDVYAAVAHDAGGDGVPAVPGVSGVADEGARVAAAPVGEDVDDAAVGDDGDARQVVVARLGGFGGEVFDETDGPVPEVVEGLAAPGDARGVVPGSKRAPRAGVGRVLADVAPGNALQETHVALAELGVVDHVVVGRAQRGGDGGGGVGGAGEVRRVYGEGNASEAAFGDGDAHEACLGPTDVVQGASDWPWMMPSAFHDV